MDKGYGQLVLKIRHKRGVFIFGTILILTHWIWALAHKGHGEGMSMFDNLVYPLGTWPNWWEWPLTFAYTGLWFMFVFSLYKARYLCTCRQAFVWSMCPLLMETIIALGHGTVFSIFELFPWPISRSSGQMHGLKLVNLCLLVMAIIAGMKWMYHANKLTKVNVFYWASFLISGTIVVSVIAYCLYSYDPPSLYLQSLPLEPDGYLLLKWLHLLSLVVFLGELIAMKRSVGKRRQDKTFYQEMTRLRSGGAVRNAMLPQSANSKKVES